jgi:hypothetical protein
MTALNRTATHWLRGFHWYGPEPGLFVADLWWPLNDPAPGRERPWW